MAVKLEQNSWPFSASNARRQLSPLHDGAAVVAMEEVCNEEVGIAPAVEEDWIFEDDLIVIEARLAKDGWEFTEVATPPAVDAAVVDSSHSVVDDGTVGVEMLEAEDFVVETVDLELSEVSIPPAVEVADVVSSQVVDEEDSEFDDLGVEMELVLVADDLGLIEVTTPPAVAVDEVLSQLVVAVEGCSAVAIFVE